MRILATLLAGQLAVAASCASERSSFGWVDDENDDLASVNVPPGGSGSWTFDLLAEGDGAGAVTLEASHTAPTVISTATVTPSTITLEDGVEADITLTVTVAATATAGQSVYVNLEATPQGGAANTRSLRVGVQ